VFYVNNANILTFIDGILLILIGPLLTFNLNLSRQRAYERKQILSDGSAPIPEPKPIVWPALISVLGCACAILAFFFAIVPNGYTGVRVTLGTIDQEPCMSGFHVLIPFVQKVDLVSNEQQDIEISGQIWCKTEEQTAVFMDNIVVTYCIVPESSVWVYTNVKNWEERLLNANIVGSALQSASQQLTADVVTDRGVIEPLAVKTLQATVNEKYGENRVGIKNVIIQNIVSGPQLLPPNTFEVSDLTGKAMEEISGKRENNDNPVRMPSLAGKEIRAAKDELVKLNLSLQIDVDEQESDSITEDYVISADPAIGTPLEVGQLVTIVVSSGLKVVPATVPYLMNMTLEDASNAITAVKLVLQGVEDGYSDTVPEGLVMFQSIAPTEDVPQGTGIIIQVSKGPSQPVYTYNPWPSPDPWPSPSTEPPVFPSPEPYVEPSPELPTESAAEQP